MHTHLEIFLLNLNKNVYGKLNNTAVYLEWKPWYNLKQQKKVVNFSTEKTLSYFFVILVFSFSRSLIFRLEFRFSSKPIAIMDWVCYSFSFNKFRVAQLILKVLISFWNAIFSYYQTTFFNRLCSFIEPIFPLRLWNSLSLFPVECVAWSNFRFAFKLFSFLCLADFTHLLKRS